MYDYIFEVELSSTPAAAVLHTTLTQTYESRHSPPVMGPGCGNLLEIEEGKKRNEEEEQ